MKLCTMCSTPLSEANCTYGKYQCRECSNKKQREYRAANREWLLRQKREAYAQNREKILGQKKEWRAAHPESVSASWQKWYEANKGSRSEWQKVYREENRERIREHDRERYKNDPHVRARRLIQARVARGWMPRASDCPCTDCGQPAQDYDHYLGYEKPFDAMVQPVCQPCHLNREKARKVGTEDALPMVHGDVPSDASERPAA